MSKRGAPYFSTTCKERVLTFDDVVLQVSMILVFISAVEVLIEPHFLSLRLFGISNAYRIHAPQLKPDLGRVYERMDEREQARVPLATSSG